MAKFLVTSGSHFEPFTYDELAKPIMQTVEAHNAAQEQYDTIADQAELLRRYVEQEPDNALVRQRYNDYMQKLESLQNNLWRSGFNASTKRDLSIARAGYNNDIARIGNAIKTRQERSEAFNKYRHEHPDAITGSDPGLASLDEYYKNDLYGQDFYNYSGNQFSAEVAADAKARASELLRDPEIKKDPRFEGYLLRIEKKGFTNQEAQNAIRAVNNLVAKYGNNLADLNNISADTEFAGLDDPSKILASVFLSHLQSTGAAGKVSPSEFGRLVQYGEFGVSSAVGDSSTAYLSDKSYDRETELIKARSSGSKSGKKEEEPPAPTFRDRYIRTSPGRNYEEVYKRYIDEFGEDGLIAGKSGMHVNNAAEAANLVYSDRTRRSYEKDLGFDVGLDVRHQKGELVSDRDGKTYEVWYDKDTDSVVIREKGTKAQPRRSKPLTEKYHIARSAYESNLNYYKKNEPEIYAAAQKLDPETQKKIYERDKVPYETPITGYGKYIFSQPGNEKEVYLSDTYLARKGVDKSNYIGAISQLMYAQMNKDKDGLVTDTERYGSFNGTSKNIHEINRDGSLVNETVKNPAEIFQFNDNHEITNIDNIRLNTDGIRKGYLIVGLTNGKNYAIGLDMLNSRDIESEFAEALSALAQVDSIKYSNASDRNEDCDLIVNRCLSGISQIIGFDDITLSRTGTGKIDEV